MRLLDLEPHFLRYEEREDTWKVCRENHEHTDDCGEVVTGPRPFYVFVDTIAEAQGIEFLCPKCFTENGGTVGTHSVICWSRSRGVPEHAEPNPGRWTLAGTGYADLTLNGDPPGNARSVLLTGGCAWHGFITDGEAA